MSFVPSMGGPPEAYREGLSEIAAPAPTPAAPEPQDDQPSPKKVPGRSARLPVVLSYLKCSVATAKRLREVRVGRILLISESHYYY